MDIFQDLPLEMLKKIMQHLTLEEILVMLDTSQIFREVARRFIRMQAHRIVILDYFLGVNEARHIQRQIFEKTGETVLVAFFDDETDIEKQLNRYKGWLVHPPQ